jgi:hypothetical protein
MDGVLMTDDAYDPGDPKSETYMDAVIDRADEKRNE